MAKTISIIIGSAYATTAFDALEAAYQQLIVRLDEVKINLSYSFNLSHHTIYCPEKKKYFASIITHFIESKK